MTTSDSRPSYDPAGSVLDHCRALVRMDTSNYGDDSGPGERKAAEYVAERLTDAGLDPELHESHPGRASVIARWDGREADAEPLLLHGHLDVVPAVADDWTVPPFAGEIVDDYLFGRGTVDMKDFDAMMLSVLEARQRAGWAPRRPIVMAFTADEEAGGRSGAHWLVDEHADLVADCTEAIGEVGGFSTHVAGRRLYLIESGEKGMTWVRLTARGNAGHGSMRHPDHAIAQLAAAVAAIGNYEWPAEPGPAMRPLLEQIRELTDSTSDDPDTLIAELGPAARMIGAGIRNTTNPTMLRAGYKVNVVPGEAHAWVDGRFLPGEREDFVAWLHEQAGSGTEVEIEHEDIALEGEFAGDLVDAMVTSLLAEDPDAHVAPYLMSGGTDAKAWHRLGIPSYGFAPLRLPADLDFTALFHGVDERVPVDALAFGARVMDRLLDQA